MLGGEARPFRRPFEARRTDGSRRAIFKAHLALKRTGPWVAPTEVPPSTSTWRQGQARRSDSAHANQDLDKKDKSQANKNARGK